MLKSRSSLKLFTCLLVLVARGLWDSDSVRIRFVTGTGPTAAVVSLAGAKNS